MPPLQLAGCVIALIVNGAGSTILMFAVVLMQPLLSFT
jgi:hypothetical protein